ncbi:oxygenase MpaB family protein [Streptomyces prasinus]|uniref:oxygenase MpaB family protein n=1 Tax=Streptomyces prasinus TaxID=67345 RepID=UPI00099E60EE|nr:oxygenase MpaB family protein [Streptomyces prasinus]
MDGGPAHTSGPDTGPAPGPGRRSEPVPFAPGSLLWDIAGDVRLLLSLPAALVLQVAHPAVGAGVDDHSVFRTDPWGRAERSLDSLQLWIYGGEQALEEGRRLRRLHKDISGTDTRGRPYHALTPAHYAWVHATAYPVFLRAARYLSHPLDERRLYDELLRLGAVLGIKQRDMPRTPEEFWPYFDTMVREELERTPVVAELLDPRRPIPPPAGAGTFLRRIWPVLRPPLARLHVFVTTGLLPPAVREHLGLAWTARDERGLRLLGAVVRTVVPLLPERLRYLPRARAARRAARRP